MWEDPANANGGKWVLTMRQNPTLLDRCWSYLCMALVGEELEDGDEICGAGASILQSWLSWFLPTITSHPPDAYNATVVSLRAKVDRIQLWTRSKTDIERLNAIARKMVKLLDLTEADNVGLEFQVRQGLRWRIEI
jgi:translation initiation factor 4E